MRGVFPALLLSLTLTLAVEMPFLYLLGVRHKKDVALVAMVNVLTNPPVVLLYWLATAYTGWNLSVPTLLLELAAVLVEALYYKRYGTKIRRPFLCSVCANTASYLLGLIVQVMI